MTAPAKPCVLLVDDRPENLVALAAVLEPLEVDLINAQSGEEALKQLLKRDVAVILLDVQMPGLDGFETAALIKERELTRHIPIIFVTAISKDAENVFRGYSEGAVDYVLKPYEPLVLRSKVAVFVDLYQKSATLEQSEERFRTAFANAPIGMAIVDTDGCWIQVNRALAELLDWSQAELIGSPWESIVHPGARSAHRKLLAGLLDGGRPSYRGESRWLRADGTVLDVSLSVSLMRGPRGRPLHLILQVEDVSERRRADAERAARAEAEAVTEMVRKLQTVSDTALAHLTLDDLLPELLERIGETLTVDSAAILLMEPGDEMLVLSAGRGPGTDEAGTRIPVATDSLVGQAALERRSVTDDTRSLLAVPLIAEGRVTGVLRVGSRTPGSFDDDDAALLSLVADRVALAIANAGLYEREHRVVETLQRSLLPERLPQLPGMEIAARYIPGARGSDIGGDWYDAIRLDRGRIGVAMGDVAGHGLAAATLMGQVRNALRAYALDGHPPAAVISRLDRMLHQVERGLATLLYGVIEADWSRLTFASAGHLPPLLRHPDGRVELLWGVQSAPLGVGGDEERSDTEITLESGSTLLLYTDGLVEVRGEVLDEGLERLREAVERGPDSADALCDHVIDALLGSAGSRDDVALLALQTTALSLDRLGLDLPADPKALINLRRMMARWLEHAGAAPEEVRDIGLACHEACANAIEHAYRFGEASVHVEAAVADGEVAITVRDTGGWREPRKGDGGRGIGLMRAVMDGVELDTGPTGTAVELRRRLASPKAAGATLVSDANERG